MIHPQDKHYQFHEKLVQALCPTTTFELVSTLKTCKRHKHNITHYLTRIGSKSKSDCVYCKFTLGKRSRTTRICAACKVPLCFSNNKECFRKYHHRNFQRKKEVKRKYRTRGLQLEATTPPIFGEVTNLRAEAKPCRIQNMWLYSKLVPFLISLYLCNHNMLFCLFYYFCW